MKTKKNNAKAEKEVASPVEKKLGAFDFVNAILRTKEDLVTTSDDPAVAIKVFNPYITNMALSNHIDTVLFANDMNERHWLEPKMQLDYLLHSVRSMNRKHTWFKKIKSEDLDTVVQYYQVSPSRAREMLALFTPPQVEELRRRLDKGGRVK